MSLVLHLKQKKIISTKHAGNPFPAIGPISSAHRYKWLELVILIYCVGSL